MRISFLAWCGAAFSAFATASQIPLDETVTKIHIVYLTHLDVGFTDTARNVCDRYFDIFFPNAFNTSEVLRKMCQQRKALRPQPHARRTALTEDAEDDNCPTYRWTQFPWLVMEFLDGLAGCSHRARTLPELAAMEAAIANDDIIWHANALNSFNELSDAELLDYSLKLRDRLNRRFGKSHGRVAAKLTDVTGMSRSAIPILARNGVKAIHIGFNGVGGLPIIPGLANTPYQSGSSFCGRDTGCPSEAVFRWRDEQSNTEILAMFEDNYGTRITLPLQTDHPFTVTKYANISDTGDSIALVFHYTSDNGGVPSAETVVSFWNNLSQAFPNARIVASSLDDFVEEATAGALWDKIPVVTKEIGDSWLYGAPSDPLKLSSFRAARRGLAQAVKSGQVSADWPQYDSYMRRLMKGPPEHNWGLSVGDACVDCRQNTTWTKSTFAQARASDFARYLCPNPGFAPGSVRWGQASGQCGYAVLEAEWAEQREWCHALPSWAAQFGWTRARRDSRAVVEAWDEAVRAIERDMAYVRAVEKPARDGAQRITLPMANSLTCGGVSVRLNSRGALVELRGDVGDWAAENRSLGLFSYVTYSRADFDEFAQEWNNHGGDFDKIGMDVANPVSGIWGAVPQGTWLTRNDDGSCRIVVDFAMANSQATDVYGAPQYIGVAYDFPAKPSVYGDQVGKGLVDVELVWMNKPASRLPESMWMSFVPLVSSPISARWEMDILGSDVDPLGVVERGTRYKHAVWSGVTLHDAKRLLKIEFVDSALVSPGDIDHLIRFSEHGSAPDAIDGGMHANLFNNLWGTAFPQYYEDDALFRFRLSEAGSD